MPGATVGTPGAGGTGRRGPFETPDRRFGASPPSGTIRPGCHPTETAFGAPTAALVVPPELLTPRSILALQRGGRKFGSHGPSRGRDAARCHRDGGWSWRRQLHAVSR